MNITHNVLAGFVSVALVFTASFGSVASAQSVEELQATLAALTAQLAALDGQAGAAAPVTVVSGSSNSACPYTWARNLTIGSTGDDVRQLQRFLNGDPQTRVATSGVGSPGNESSYYGPATARAVSKFQEKYATQVLAPFGLSKGTGGFYTSTRKQANSMCAVVSSTPTPIVTTPPVNTGGYNTPPIRVVSGDTLSVTAGRQIGDSYALQAAQRVPFTSFVLTAGSEDVRIEGIQVTRVGLSSSDAIDSVALVDSNGVQIGSSRSLNSRDEATLGGNLVIPRNRSMTLALVANMATEDVSAGAVIGLEVTSVTADVAVQGQFPIRGAMHAVADSVDLQLVEVELMKGEDEVEFDQDTEVVEIEVQLTSKKADGSTGADQEDAYLRSIVLEQNGSADEREVGDVMVYVDDDEADARISVEGGDRYAITFDGRGVEIEEGDSITVVLEVNTDEGTGEDIKFELDDVSDVYVVGASYGYGLPVEETTNLDGSDSSSYESWSGAEIKAGDIEKGRVRNFEDEITYGDDRIIGALEVEFEGEDIDIEDLEFRITLSDFPYEDPDVANVDDNAWEKAGEDSVTLDNLHLRVDGKKVLYADDTVEFDEPSSTEADADIDQTVEFSGSFTIDVRGTREVRFELVADLDDAWSHFDDANIKAELIGVDTAEGVRSEEDFTKVANNVFNVSSVAGDGTEFEDVEIVGNSIDFEITDDGVDQSTVVAGSEDIVFGTLEIDASNSIDDVEVDSLYVTFSTPAASNGGKDGSTLDDVDDCRVFDRRGDEVADARGSLSSAAQTGATAHTDQIRFRFSRFVVDGGETVEVDIVCDVDDDAGAGHVYQIAAVAADNAEYSIGRDDFDFKEFAGDRSEAITVSGTGTLKVTFDNPDSNNQIFPVAVGQSGVGDVEVLDIDFEAEDEDIRIKDIYLAGITLPAGATLGSSTTKDAARKALNQVLRSLTLSFGGNSVKASPSDFDDTENVKTDNPDGSDTEETTTIEDFIVFENVNRTVDTSDEENATLTLHFDGNNDNKGQAGQYFKAATLYVVWEGVETEREQMLATRNAGGAVTGGIPISSSDFSSAIAFRNALRVSNPSSHNLTLGNGTKKLYEFTVHALDGNHDDAYLKKVGVDVTLSSGVSIGDLAIYEGTSSSNSILDTVNASGSRITTTGTYAFVFDDVQRIDDGQSVTYSVYGRGIQGAVTDKSIIVDLALDDDANDQNKLGDDYPTVAGLSNFVWSPNALDNDGLAGASDNDDWFSGWAVLRDGDVNEWSTERD